MGTISEKLTYLNETKQKFKTYINTFGGTLTSESTFRSYIDELNSIIIDSIEGTIDLFTLYPKYTGSANSADLNGTESAKIRFSLSPKEITQSATPTPTSPVEINVIKGNNNIKIQNKNLFDKNNMNVYNGNISTSDLQMKSATANRSLWISCKPNTTYTVQKRNDGDTNRFAIASSTVSPSNNSVLTQVDRSDNGKVLTMTTGASDIYLIVQFYRTAESTLTYQQVIDSIQIEENEEATKYVEHLEQNFAINLGLLEYAKMGTTEDEIYRDSNGDWYIEEKIMKLTLDGTESITNQFGASLFGTNLANKKKVATGDTYSNYYTFNPLQSGLNAGLTSGEFATQYGQTLYIKDERFTDVPTFKTFLTNNTVKIYYELYEPITTQITDSDLIDALDALYYNAMSYKEQTHISQTNGDLPFTLNYTVLKQI